MAPSLSVDEAAEAAVAELLRASTDISAMVVLDAGDEVVASGGGARDPEPARRLWAVAEAAATRRGREIDHVVVDVADGAVIAVRTGDLLGVAVARRHPAVRLALLDLRTCLEAIAASRIPA